MAGEIVDRVGVKVTPDTTTFRTDLRAALAKINEDVTVGLNVDTKRASSTLAAWRSREDGKEVNQKVDVNSDGLNKATSLLSTFSRTAGTAALGITAIVSGLNLAASAAPVLVASVGALGVLPGLGLAGAAAMLAFKLGANGVTQAIAPLKAQTTEMGTAISGVFATQLPAAVSRVIPIFATLKSGMVGVTQAITSAALPLADVLVQANKAGTIKVIFDGIAQVIRNLGAALAPLAGAFLNIAAVSADVLGGLTAGAGAAAQKFADFVAHARETGQMKEWMLGGIDALKQIWGILTQLGGIVAGVFRGLQSGGVGIAGAFGAALGAINAFINSPAGQSLLHELGLALSTIATTVSGVLTTAFATLGPAVQAILPGIREFVLQIGTVLKDALTVVGPILTGLFTFLSSNMGWIGPAAIGIAAIVAALRVWAVVQAVLNAVMMANPVMLIVGLIIAAVAIIIANWTQVKDFFIMIWEAIKTAAVAVWDFIKMVVGAVADWFVARWTDISGFFQGLWNGISAFFTGLWNGIKAVVAGIADWFVARWNDISGFFHNLWDGIKFFIQASVEAWRNLFGGIADWFVARWNDVAGFFRGVWDGIVNVVRGVAGAVTNIWNGAIEGIKGFFAGVGSFVSGIWGGIVGGLKSALNGAIGALNGIINGINIIPGVNIPHIPYLAEGGTITGSGTVLVGERGPELLSLTKGAQVTPLTSARKRTALSGGDGAGNQYGDVYVTIDAETIEQMLNVRQFFDTIQTAARQGPTRIGGVRG